MSIGAVSNVQFNTERSFIQQGNPSDELVKSRGLQNLTSNVYKPSFSGDYTTVRAFKSPARSAADEEMYGGEEEE